MTEEGPREMNVSVTGVLSGAGDPDDFTSGFVDWVEGMGWQFGGQVGGDWLGGGDEGLALVQCDCCPSHFFWWKEGMAHVCDACFLSLEHTAQVSGGEAPLMALYKDALARIETLERTRDYLSETAVALDNHLREAEVGGGLRAALGDVVRDVLEPLAAIECHCDEAYTARGRHEPNAFHADFEDIIVAARRTLEAMPR